MTYWMNGAFADEMSAVSTADRGFLLGDGVFETVLVINGVPVFWDAHLQRLQNGLKALQIDAPLQELSTDLVSALAERNGLETRTAALRLTVSRGPGGRGLLAPTPAQSNPTMLLTMAAYDAPPSKAAIRLGISQYRRCEQSISARNKTLNYLDNSLARNEAAASGAGEAVMLNSAGRVACVSAGNIFVFRGDNSLITPPVEEGALPGIVRQHILGRAHEAGLSVAEAPIETHALEKATLIVTNSLMGIRGATLAEDDSSLPDQGLKIIHRLQSWYQNIVDEDVASRAAQV